MIRRWNLFTARVLYFARDARCRGNAGSKTGLLFLAEPGIVWGKGDTEPAITRVKRTMAEKCGMMGGTNISL